MSIPFEIFLERIKALGTRTMSRHNYRRLTLDDYAGKGLVVMSKKGKGDKLHYAGRREISDVSELDELLHECRSIDVVQKIRDSPPAVSLKSSKDAGGQYYEAKFGDNSFRWFKKWHYSKEEREVRKILDSIGDKEGPVSQRGHIVLSVRFACRNYDEMLGVLQCIDDLYAMMIDRGYHNPSYSLKDKFSGIQRRFELPKIRAQASWRYSHICVDSSDLKYLFFDMLRCKRKHGGFTLEDDMLLQSHAGKRPSKSEIGDRSWIGKVHDKGLFEAYKGGPRFATSGYDLCARIVPPHK